MDRIVRNYVVKNLLAYLQGKETEDRISNVRLFWHGEFGPIAQSFVHIKSLKGEYVVDFEDYMTKADHASWFNDLVNDITSVVMEMIEPDEDMKMNLIVEDIKEQYLYK